MDFSLTQEQDMLRDAVERFGRAHGGFADWRRSVAGRLPYDAANWQRMADLGWLAISVPEAAGGLGFSAVETMLVMEGVGRTLAREPYVGTCVLAPFLLAHAAPRRGTAIYPAIAAGAVRVALAATEPQSRFDLAQVATFAHRQDDGFVLTGTKSYVLDGAFADWFVVSARSAGAADAADGITLFLVPHDALGLTRTAFRAPDHRHDARLELHAVTVPADAVIGTVDAGLPLLEHAVDRAIAARLAEAVGAMEMLRDTTLEYLKTRRQFGAPIGTFQVLQHRMVDMAMACEEARALMLYATLQLDAPPLQRRRAVSGAKARIGQAALFVGQQAVQLHGGIGTSDELAVSHYLKRLLMIDLCYGNADYHRALFARAEDALAVR